jgi:hypothetical protein
VHGSRLKSSEYLDENSDTAAETPNQNSEWNKIMITCGSNAFNQACFSDLMSTKFKPLTAVKNFTITTISCGSTMTAAVFDDNLHVWGSGLPGGLLKVPTLVQVTKRPLKIYYVIFLNSNKKILLLAEE